MAFFFLKKENLGSGSLSYRTDLSDFNNIKFFVKSMSENKILSNNHYFSYPNQYI